MARVNLAITDEMDQALKSIAEERGAPIAVIMREAVTEYLAARGITVEKKPKWGGHRKSKNQGTESAPSE